jgi:hypothetical protein
VTIESQIAGWEDRGHEQQGASTPGPWLVERDGWNYQWIYGKDSRVPGESRYIAEVSLDYDGAEANAILIAAAPELLALLEKATCNTGGLHFSWVPEAIALFRRMGRR